MGSKILVGVLLVIAVVVAGILAAGGNAWAFIVAYWVVLSIKNIVDLIVFQKNK